MMKYEEIMALLDKGFTAEYIMNMDLSDNSDSKDPEEKPSDPDPEEKPDEKQEDAQAAAFGDMFNKFGEKLDSLIHEMQAANIMNSRQEHEEPLSAEDALAAIIMPQNKGGK